MFSYLYFYDWHYKPLYQGGTVDSIHTYIQIELVIEFAIEDINIRN